MLNALTTTCLQLYRTVIYLCLSIKHKVVMHYNKFTMVNGDC